MLAQQGQAFGGGQGSEIEPIFAQTRFKLDFLTQPTVRGDQRGRRLLPCSCELLPPTALQAGRGLLPFHKLLGAAVLRASGCPTPRPLLMCKLLVAAASSPSSVNTSLHNVLPLPPQTVLHPPPTNLQGLLDLGLDIRKVDVARKVAPGDELLVMAYPHFNVNEMIAVEEMWRGAAAERGIPILVFNGELDRIRRARDYVGTAAALEAAAAAAGVQGTLESGGACAA